MRTGQEWFEIGVQIAKVSLQILAMDLEELVRGVDYWETVMPMLDPTKYIKDRKTMEAMKRKAEILLTAKVALANLPQER